MGNLVAKFLEELIRKIPNFPLKTEDIGFHNRILKMFNEIIKKIHMNPDCYSDNQKTLK